MNNKRKKANGLNIALGVLLVTWGILLLMLIVVFVMRMQGYQNFQEWINRNEPEITQGPTKTPEPTKAPTAAPTPTIELPMNSPTAPTAAPTETGTPQATLTPTPTNSPTPTLMPTPTPAFLEALTVSGDEVVDADIRRQAIAFAGLADIELVYEAYKVENYLSVVFHKVEVTPEGAKECLLPLVYDLTAQKQITGSDLIKESYFAIVKERLQTYVAEKFPAAEGSDFITYMETYQEEDYQQIYLTEEKLVFWFEENTLLAEGQEAFLYEVSLEEAKTFFKYNLDGTKSGIAIRELDPDKPMVAFTFDDGPAFKDDLDWKLAELFQQYGGRATFFFVGNRMWEQYQSFGKVAAKLYEAGFEVASHTYSHDTTAVQFYSGLDSQKPLIWQEFNMTNLAIAAATGHAPDYVRLPGGSVGKWTKELPLPIINWDIDSIDYNEKKKGNGGTIIFERLKNANIQDGSIILLHSIYQTSYEATEMILPYLAKQGYQFVTLSELFYYKGIVLEDGVICTDAVE